MKRRAMDLRKGTERAAFTLIELLVVIAIIALLLSVLIPSLNRARENGKRAVCLSNLKQLLLSWTMYADSNRDRIVCGDAEEYGDADAKTGLYAPRQVHFGEMPWVRRDWFLKDEASKTQAIMGGALYPYVDNVKLYKCPTGLRGELRLYTIVDAMNCVALEDCGEGAQMIKNRLQIEKPAERFVFLDDGGTGGHTLGGWTNYVREDKWWDPPPVRHGKGTTFGFADGHSGHVRWMDARTHDFAAKGTAFSQEQAENRDILVAQTGSWGSPPARPVMDE